MNSICKKRRRVRYLMWRRRQNRHRVRMLEFEKLRWLWQRQKKGLDWDPSDCMSSSSSSTIRSPSPAALAATTASASAPMANAIMYDNDKRDSFPLHFHHLSSPTPLFVLGKKEHGNCDVSSSSSAVTLACPCLQSDGWYPQVADKERTLPFFSSPSSSSTAYSGRSSAMSPPHTILPPSSSSSSSSSTTLPTTNDIKHAKKTRFFDSWKWYDTKIKRRRMIWQWSVAMGHCTYEHARTISTIIEKWEHV
ncbi:hypothetical protein BC940DRAFT_320688 [Gongronella butleri]|nr:hypothetical protein BC940DRAFT_320688 [Gongronella butleri]